MGFSLGLPRAQPGINVFRPLHQRWLGWHIIDAMLTQRMTHEMRFLSRPRPPGRQPPKLHPVRVQASPLNSLTLTGAPRSASERRVLSTCACPVRSFLPTAGISPSGMGDSESFGPFDNLRGSTPLNPKTFRLRASFAFSTILARVLARLAARSASEPAFWRMRPGLRTFSGAYCFFLEKGSFPKVCAFSFEFGLMVLSRFLGCFSGPLWADHKREKRRP